MIKAAKVIFFGPENEPDLTQMVFVIIARIKNKTPILCLPNAEKIVMKYDVFEKKKIKIPIYKTFLQS